LASAICIVSDYVQVPDLACLGRDVLSPVLLTEHDSEKQVSLRSSPELSAVRGIPEWVENTHSREYKGGIDHSIQNVDFVLKTEQN
jgi:hypothetical protein